MHWTLLCIIYLLQMKYECAVRHGVKVVTPEWLIDSINMGTLMEEGDYCPRGRGRGHHTHLAEQEEVVQCNGELTENPIGDNQRTTAVISGPMTTEIHHKDHDQTAANCTEAVSMPTETPCVPSPNNQQTTDTSDNVAPLPKTTEGKCEGAEGGWESGGGEGGEEMEIMSGEGELGEESAVSPAPAAHGDITPAASDVSVVNSTTALQNGLSTDCPDRATTAATSHHSGPGAEPSGVGENGLSTGCPDRATTAATSHHRATTAATSHHSGPGAEPSGVGEDECHLLAGLTFHLTGYLEYMEEDTLAKWKEVSQSLQQYCFNIHVIHVSGVYAAVC